MYDDASGMNIAVNSQLSKKRDIFPSDRRSGSEPESWIKYFKRVLRLSQDNITDLEERARKNNRNYSERLCNLKDGYENRELDLNNRIISLERTVEEQESRVRKAQTAAQVMTEQNKSFALSDSDVVAWFEDMATDVYTWARSYTCDDSQESSSIPAEVWNSLGKFVVLDNGHLPEALVSNNDTACLLLQGMAMNYICVEAFSSPWWVFDAIGDFDFALNEDNLAQITQGDIELAAQIQNLVYTEVPNIKDHMATLFDLLQNGMLCPTHMKPSFPGLLNTNQDVQFKKILVTSGECR